MYFCYFFNGKFYWCVMFEINNYLDFDNFMFKFYKDVWVYLLKTYLYSMNL